MPDVGKTSKQAEKKGRNKIDGKYYPCYDNLIEASKRNIPLLFSDDVDAIKVREWFRGNVDGFNGKHWLEHLWWVSNLFMQNGFKEEWLGLDVRTRERKIKKIVGTIRKLQVLLDDEALPEIPKAYELMKCYYIASMRIAPLIHEFCEKEGQKPPFQEEVVDLLGGIACRLKQELDLANFVRPNQRGDVIEKNFCRGLYTFMRDRFGEKEKLSDVVMSLVGLKYPNYEISEGKVNGWLREIIKKRKQL